MTVFRVNIERDKADVVKKLKQHKDVVKATEEWSKVCQAFQATIQKDAPKVIALSRKVYTLCDKKMKELKGSSKKGDADAYIALEDLRKSSWEMTTALKKLGLT